MSSHAFPLRKGISPIQLLLLVQMKHGPKYGYEMLTNIREEFNGVWEPQTGTIYPALKNLESKGLMFPDFKIEYGRDSEGNIVLGDEISPDTCRFWDRETCDVLDKDLFRKGESGVIEAYRRVAELILDEDDRKRWSLDF